MKAFVLLLISLLVTLCSSQFVPCPPKIGDCNQCSKIDDMIVAHTRKICGTYTRAKCIEIHNGEVFVCDDKCNQCRCEETGIASTLNRCPPYNYVACLAVNGPAFKQNNDTVYCTEYGMAFAI